MIETWNNVMFFFIKHEIKLQEFGVIIRNPFLESIDSNFPQRNYKFFQNPNL